MKKYGFVIIVLVALIGVGVSVGILLYNKTHSRKYDQYNEQPTYVDVEDLVTDGESLLGKIYADREYSDEIQFEFDLEEYCDYYVSMYIRGALKEYIQSYGNLDSFSIVEDIVSIDGSDKISIVLTDGTNNIKVIMDRLTDTWEWFIVD